jgi:capsular exopolysaccharide synthesis family protein
VLLIDADMRSSSIHKKLKLENKLGLSNILAGFNKYTECITPINESLDVITAGQVPPNPSELLGSRRMETVLKELREAFDYIIIDLPPVNIVSDALSISSLITGMIVVIREDYTEKKELEHCFRLLKLSNVNVLGCVMNEAKAGGGSYSKYKKYKYYRYYTSSHKSTSANKAE